MTTLVSQISIVPIGRSQNGLIAFAECLLDGKFYVGGIGVYTLLNGSGFRLTYPTKALANGTQIPLFHPTDSITGQEIQRAISAEVKRLLMPITNLEPERG